VRASRDGQRNAHEAYRRAGAKVGQAAMAIPSPRLAMKE
jgi:hypothetical protein